MGHRRSGFGLVCHDALDELGLAVLVDEELSDASSPRPNVSKELLQILDAAFGEGGDAFYRPIIDLNHLAIIDIVVVHSDLLKEFEILANPRFAAAGQMSSRSAQLPPLLFPV